MKTLKEPQEPFCPPFPLPLSPLSRRPRVAFCAFNQQLFLSFFERFDDECFLSRLSLSLSCKTTKKRARDYFFRLKKHKKRLFPPPKRWKERSLVFFIFFVSTDPTAGIRIKKIRKNCDI